MKRPTSSKQWIKAMLDTQLDGNAMKILFAYMDKGAWDSGKASFLSRKDYEAYGISRSTVVRHRASLIEAGWLIKTGQKSENKYEYCLVELGGGVSKRAAKCVNLTQGVSQIDTGGESKRVTEVIEEEREEVIDEEREASPLVPHDEGDSLEDNNDKEDQEDQEDKTILIGDNQTVPAEETISTETKGVGQIDTPTDDEENYYEWNGRKIKKAGVGNPFDDVTTPVEPEEPKVPCPICGVTMEKDLCWNMACAS